MNIFLLELDNLRKSAIITAIALGGVTFAMMTFFPAMQNSAMQALTGAYLEGINPAVLKGLGLSAMPDFSVITYYFGYIVQYLSLALAVVTMQRAAALFIKEETEGTIEYLCARPVSRSDIFVQKFLAHLLILVGHVCVCALSTLVAYVAFSDFAFEKAVAEVAVFYGAIGFVCLVFSALGLLASVWLKSSKSAAGVAFGVVFGAFLLGILSAVVDMLSFLLHIAPMEWIKAEKLIASGLHLSEWLVGGGVMLVCTIAAWLIYRRKDLLI